MARRKIKSKGSMIGVCYARYSSHRQKDVSIEQQVAACQAHAANLGIALVESYEDRAISGKTDNRPAFRRMMRDAEAGLFAYVIAWKSNRIGRNMMEAMVNEARLSELGVKVLYVEEDFDDSAAGRFALRSMMNVNQFYIENMAEDIRRGMRDNAKNCKVNGPLPYGYRKGADGKIEINEPQAAIVREIYRRIAVGDPFMTIANDLNARGIRNARGNEWQRCSFHRLITNERYRGVYQYDDIRIEGGMPRIISDELYYRVQRVLKTKKNPQGLARRRAPAGYLLTGKLFCGRCKAPMIGVSGTSQNGVLHYYYACQRRHQDHSCGKKNLRRDTIEQAVAQAIRCYVLTPDVIDAIADSAVEYGKRMERESPVTMMEDQLNDVKAAIRNLLKAIEEGILTASTKNRMRELEDEQADLQRQLLAAQAALVTIDKPKVVAWLTQLQRGNIKDRDYLETLINTFVTAIYVYDDTLKVIFTYSGGGADVPLSAITDADAAELSASHAVRVTSSLGHHLKSLKSLQRNDFMGFLFSAISQILRFRPSFWGRFEPVDRSGCQSD